MSEEAVAEAIIEEPSIEESNDFPMEEALSDISADLFPKSAANESKESSEDKPDAEPSAKTEPKVETKAEEANKKPEASATEEKPETPALEKIDLPASWKKDFEEKWGNLDSDTQKYILKREEQMKDGIEVANEDTSLGRSMRDAISPYNEMLQSRGIEAPQAVKSLLQAHQTLSSGTIEQKQAYLQQLAGAYGIGAPQEGSDPTVTALMQKVQMLEQNHNATQESARQAEEERVKSEVSTFAETHPHFDELSGDITIFINGGLSLEDAYTKALNANEGIKGKEIERMVSERLEAEREQAKKEAEEAKKAKAVNVRGRDTNKAPTEKVGTMDDTLRETFRKINSN